MLWKGRSTQNKYLHQTQLWSILQFAYQPKRSTDDAIITLIHNLAQHLDGVSKYARCLFIDYSSAFNTMQPHVKLIERLAAYNVPARLPVVCARFPNCNRSAVCSNEQSWAVIYHYDQHRSPTRMRFNAAFLFHCVHKCSYLNVRPTAKS